MSAPDNTSRRLRLVDDNQHHRDDALDAGSEDRRTDLEDPQSPADGLSAKQAAAFAALVAEKNQAAISYTLEQMGAEQLRTLAIALATQVNAAETAEGEVADVGPDGLCSIAVASAAQAFGTTRDAVLSADRHRAVTDARAVAMTAARRGGLTLPAIGAYFSKDHTTVMYNLTKVANNPRLEAVCNRIVDQLDDHYAAPTRVPAEDPAATGLAAAGRSSTLQLAAIEQARTDTARRARDEDAQRVPIAAPAR
ncbi:helix-turn-helix domain-containing protein [Nocardioides sp. PD653]|uniref:helix-turn-helix domain-containing protein n=1 Tax=Nocardioides sp. PD653 TaxID=393303 RepID=UPI0009F13328|nr:helix-turn-helix domain-containing protein [Nocardioides sp. PD653]GAW54788.1 chromosomal replication initiator DnaA domain-containing protein [Nocardioides sp. PD653]